MTVGREDEMYYGWPSVDRMATVLRDTEDELIRVGASEECLATFRSQMLDQFACV